jgi:small-conductance mechanosensitive channel
MNVSVSMGVRMSDRAAVGTLGRLFAVAFVGLLVALATGIAGAQTGDAGGVPVRLDGKELFRIHRGVGPLSAQDRAKLSEARLYDLALNPFRPPGEFSLREFEIHTELLYADELITSVTDEDSAVAGIPRAQLAVERLELIRSEVTTRRAEYFRPRTLLLGLLATAALTVVMWFVVGFIRRRLAIRAAALMAADVPPDENLPGKAESGVLARLPVRHALGRAVLAGRTGVLLAAIAVYLFAVMSFFPRSRFVADELLERLLVVLATVWNGFAGYVPNLIFLAVIMLITYAVIRVVRFLFGEVSRGSLSFPGFEPEWSEPTYKIATFLIIALALVMAFPYLPGSQSQAFQAVSLFLGLLISLSSSSAISNIIAGVILTYTGAFRMGDRVKIADAVGDVVGKTLLVTRVRTVKNVDIAIPNALVLSSHIVNYSRAARAEGVILHTSVTIGYNVPWRQIHELLIAAAKKTAEVIDEPAPFVLQTSLDDFYVTYELNVYTRNPWRMSVIYSDLHRNIQDAFNEACVEIMSPHFASVRDGNAQATPETYLPENYEAPEFRILPRILPK